MNRSRILATAGLFALSACGASSGSSLPSAGQAAGPMTQAAAAAADMARRKFGRLTFNFQLPAKEHRAPHGRLSPNFIPVHTASVSITIDSVNGGSPPAGLAKTKTTAITQAACNPACVVSGPASPPGSDGFTVTVKDESGNALSRASKTFIIKTGIANNSGSITLLGVPASFSITGIPLTGTVAVGTSSQIALHVLDAAGDTITGTYSKPVTVTDSDASGATGLTLNNAPTPQTSVQVTKNTDTLETFYSGLAIVPAVFTAHADGATNGVVTFTPSIINPASVCKAAGTGSDTTPCATPGPQINLYAAAGTGSTAAFSASQPGWQSANFHRTFTQSNTCAGVATISTPDNVTFTAAAAGATTATTCHVTITGGANASIDVPITFTTSSIGISSRHHRSSP
jgi:hypothetical protein